MNYPQNQGQEQQIYQQKPQPTPPAPTDQIQINFTSNPNMYQNISSSVQKKLESNNEIVSESYMYSDHQQDLANVDDIRKLPGYKDVKKSKP